MVFWSAARLSTCGGETTISVRVQECIPLGVPISIGIVFEVLRIVIVSGVLWDNPFRW